MKRMEKIGFQEYLRQEVKQPELQKELHGKRQKLFKKKLENLSLEEKNIKAEKKIIENKEDDNYIYIFKK